MAYDRDFEKSLAFGQAGESAIACWMRRRGNALLPVYEKILDTGKGPQVFTDTQTIIATDFFAWRGRDAEWVEAKHKSAFAWNRRAQKWVTGIDQRHYDDYCVLDQMSPWPVWLLFLHRPGNCAKDSPPGCPSGLFGQKLSYLTQHVLERWPGRHADHRDAMVYWSHTKLRFLDTYENVVNLAGRSEIPVAAQAELFPSLSIQSVNNACGGTPSWPHISTT